MRRVDIHTLWLSMMLLCSIFSVCYFWDLYEQYPHNREIEKQLRAQADTNEKWVVSYQRAVRYGKIYQIDATDDFLYLSYSKDNCVDVFDHSGIFQYALLFPSGKNGSISVRCEGNLVYISDKSDSVYVLNGCTEMKSMSDAEAREVGINFYWFSSNQKNHKIENGVFYKYKNGEIILKASLPSLQTEYRVFRTFLVTVAVFIFLVTTIRRRTGDGTVCGEDTGDGTMC